MKLKFVHIESGLQVHLQVSLGKGHLRLYCLHDQMNISDVVTIISKILLYNALWICLSAIFFFRIFLLGVAS